MSDRTFNIYDVEAALCVWEELLNRRTTTSCAPDPLNIYWDNYGTSQLRFDAIDIAEWIDKVWNFFDKHPRYQDRVNNWISFDWEFVPLMIDQLHNYWLMSKRDGKFPTPTVESAAYHYLLAHGRNP